MIGLAIEQPPDSVSDELKEYLVRQLENIAAALDTTNDFDGLSQYPTKYSDGMLRYAYESDDFPSEGFYAVVNGQWKAVGNDEAVCALEIAETTTGCPPIDTSKANIFYGAGPQGVKSFWGLSPGGTPYILGLEYVSDVNVGIGIRVDQLIISARNNFFNLDGTLGYTKEPDGTPKLYLRHNLEWWSVNMTKVI